MEHPRFVLAGNGGPFTLDGTRTYIVGERRLAVVDPGPALDSHVRAVAEAVRGAEQVTIVLTHGHVDHAPAAPLLAEQTGGDICGPPGLDGLDHALLEGDSVATDRGDLVVVDTPGHARHHIGLHWVDREAFFAGDLLLGKGDTTWVGEYADCVADYLTSLARVRALNLRVIYPAHGDPLEDPMGAIARFDTHRRKRIRQMEETLRAHPGASAEELLALIYGTDLPDGARRAATMSLQALKEHVERSPD